ncbi:Uma2 family endonuclease [Aquisphaera insulae]|uniref:Uma2 family endonuclease n=1 Tax=Aquisphaera insulae TaxID=2712864 RepID=UPI0013EB4BD3|nr:Uma2 family endonuclease [Aquisphaera insulae]
MSRIFLPKPLDHVVYPDSDGRPMAENTLQYHWIVLIKENLEILFRDRNDVFVAGDLFWYPVEGDPRIVTAPDVMVAIGRPKGRRGSYRQWEEDGIAPQVVFEIRSPSNDDAEMAEKLRFYDRFGAREFYDFDPDTGKLLGWLRKGRGLKPVPMVYGSTSPLLKIRFERADPPEYLRLLDPRGRLFQTSVELADERDEADRRADIERDRADIESDRADLERDRADLERDRADLERDRADRLAAKLRELGIEAE